MRREIARFDDSRTDIATLTNAVATLIPRPLSAMAARGVANALKIAERFYCGKASGHVTVREGGSTRVLEPPHGLEPKPFYLGAQRKRVERIDPMSTDSVYRIVDVVGVSEKSEEAGRNAVETVAGSLRDLRVAEVTKMDMRVENGEVTAFRTRVALSFKYEA